VTTPKRPRRTGSQTLADPGASVRRDPVMRITPSRRVGDGNAYGPRAVRDFVEKSHRLQTRSRSPHHDSTVMPSASGCAISTAPHLMIDLLPGGDMRHGSPDKDPNSPTKPHHHGIVRRACSDGVDSERWIEPPRLRASLDTGPWVRLYRRSWAGSRKGQRDVRKSSPLRT